MKKLLTTLLLLLFISPCTYAENPVKENNPFLGMWTLDIEGGKVGWLEVHEKQGFLDANLLWVGGSVLPVASVYLADENTLVVTRIRELKKHTDAEGNVRKHTLTTLFRMHLVGDHLSGMMTQPHWRGNQENTMAFVGKRLPKVPAAPDLSQVKYGEPITLFNGKDLTGWHVINPEHANGFKAVDGILVNDP